MIAITRTLTCNFCGQWLAIDDLETARDARRRAHADGWRNYPNARDRRKSIDACPKHLEVTP